MPASCISATARAAISGVCSAGLAMTALPAASAPRIWPEKMASGEVPGRDAGDHAAGSASALAVQAQSLARVEAREVAGLAHLRHAVWQGLAGLACREGEELRRVLLVEIGDATEPACAFLAA